MLYSNCLFEALKAKIKDPKNIKILYLPGKIFGTHFHIMWKEGNEIKHAYNSNYNNFCTGLFYKVKYNTNSFEAFESYVLSCLKREKYETRLKYAKKFNLKSANIEGVLNWAYKSGEDILPSTTDFNYLNRVLKGKLIIKIILDEKIETIAFDELLKLNTAYYKYITPFDEDYCEIFGY